MYKYFILSLVIIFINIPLVYSQTCTPYSGNKTLSHSKYQFTWDEELGNAKFYRLVGGVPTPISDAEFKSLVYSYLNSAFSTFAYYTDGVVKSGTNDGIINVRFIANGDHWGQTTTEPAGGGDTSEILISPWKFTDQAVLMSSIYGNCNIGKGYGHLKSVIFHEMYHIFMGAGEGSACSSDINIRTFCCNVIKTSPTQCDKDAVRNAYNPEHTVTVKNSFGSGGDVKVDGTVMLKLERDFC